MKEIRKLWGEVGEASGKTDVPAQDGAWKSRRGFGYRVRQARSRPSNTSARNLCNGRRQVRWSGSEYPSEHAVADVLEGALSRGQHVLATFLLSSFHSIFFFSFSFRGRTMVAIGYQDRQQERFPCFSPLLYP